MRNFLLGIFMLFPISALATPGHDHSHWSSSMFHSVFAIAIFAVFAVAGYFVAKRFVAKHARSKK